MNSTMTWSLAAATAILVGVIVAVVITSRPQDSESINNPTQTSDIENSIDSQVEADTQAEFLANFEPFSEPVDELQTIDTQEGDGDAVQAGDSITVNYTGAYVATGEIFDSNAGGEPISFPLSGVIQGWQEGVPGMREGGVRRVVIPGELAYGAAPEGYVPGEDGGRPLGPLVFDIELISIDDQESGQ